MEVDLTLTSPPTTKTNDDDNKAKNRENLPWVEKYRPSTLSDLIAHTSILTIITKLIDTDNLPHLLLYGPPGTGKTSTILAAAKRMYGEKNYSTMALELNASDARGIDVVRYQIKEFAGTRQLFNTGIKLIILDEADAMTSDAQNALRRIVEKYTTNARFCLICNYVSKIIPALQSRCTRFRFAPLEKHQIEGRLDYIVKEERLECTDNGKEAILSLAGGDMRRVLNTLQSTAMAYPDQPIDEIKVYHTTGSPLPDDIGEISNALWNDSIAEAHGKIYRMCKEKGYALVDILQDLEVVVTSMKLPPGVLAQVLDGMSGVEYRLAFGTDEMLQCAALVGVFVKARSVMKMKVEVGDVVEGEEKDGTSEEKESDAMEQ